MSKFKDNFSSESFYPDSNFYAENEKDLAEFEKRRHKNAEVLGWKLTGKSDIKPLKEKTKVIK